MECDPCPGRQSGGVHRPSPRARPPPPGTPSLADRIKSGFDPWATTDFTFRRSKAACQRQCRATSLRSGPKTCASSFVSRLPMRGNRSPVACASWQALLGGGTSKRHHEAVAPVNTSRSCLTHHASCMYHASVADLHHSSSSADNILGKGKDNWARCAHHNPCLAYAPMLTCGIDLCAGLLCLELGGFSPSWAASRRSPRPGRGTVNYLGCS